MLRIGSPSNSRINRRDMGEGGAKEGRAAVNISDEVC